eukprot:3094400-Amphidinium_carterae.1
MNFAALSLVLFFKTWSPSGKNPEVALNLLNVWPGIDPLDQHALRTLSFWHSTIRQHGITSTMHDCWTMELMQVKRGRSVQNMIT